MWLDVHEANFFDGVAAARRLTGDLRQNLPRLELIWADKGYRGQFVQRMEELDLMVVIPGSISEERPYVSRWRWVVERTFGWLNHFRRLSKDYEHHISSAKGWIYLSMISIMARRLRPP